MRLGLQATADYFKDKGDIGITKSFLYWGARRKELPHFRVASRYIFDTELLEKHFKDISLNNVKK